MSDTHRSAEAPVWASVDAPAPKDRLAIEFKVHGVNTTATSADVEVNGEPIRATIPCYEVELTTVDPRHGSLVLRFVGKDVEAAKAKFPHDGTVVWTV